MVEKVFMEKKKLFTGKVNLELKKRIMKCFVWSVALYAAETWTLTQTDRRRLKCGYGEEWKRSAGLIKLLMRTFSESKRRQAILNSIWQRKQRWMCHVLRHNGFLHEIIEGRMKGKPKRWRRRIQMLHALGNKKLSRF